MPKLSFEEAFKKIIDVEGANKTHHPDDPGGRTKWGIAERFHPEYWVNGEPDYDDALDFYGRQWNAMRLDEIEYYAIAHELFDTATLHGPGRAAIFLQTAYNYWNWILRKKGETPVQPFELKVDGAMGPVTVAAVNKFCAKSPSHYRALYTMMNHLQANRIMSNENPSFQIGWFANRICGMLNYEWK